MFGDLTLLGVLLSTQSRSEIILKPPKGLRNCSAVQLPSCCGCSSSLGIAGSVCSHGSAGHALCHGLAANHAAASQRHGMGLMAQGSSLPLSLLFKAVLGRAWSSGWSSGRGPCPLQGGWNEMAFQPKPFCDPGDTWLLCYFVVLYHSVYYLCTGDVGFVLVWSFRRGLNAASVGSLGDTTLDSGASQSEEAVLILGSVASCLACEMGQVPSSTMGAGVTGNVCVHLEPGRTFIAPCTHRSSVQTL